MRNLRCLAHDGRTSGELALDYPNDNADAQILTLEAETPIAVAIPDGAAVCLIRSHGGFPYVIIRDDDSVDDLPDMAGANSGGWFPLLTGIIVQDLQAKTLVFQCETATALDLMWYSW